MTRHSKCKGYETDCPSTGKELEASLRAVMAGEQYERRRAEKAEAELAAARAALDWARTPEGREAMLSPPEYAVAVKAAIAAARTEGGE